jgi:hypothetical protein
MLLSFASDSTGEAVGEITRAIRVEHPQLEILALIDLSRFPGFARGFVAREIAKRHDAAVERTREAFVRAGKPAPDDLDARIHTVPDFEAKACERYGAGDAGSQPRIVLVGAEGRVAAVFTRTPMLAEVEAAVARTLGGARSP